MEFYMLGSTALFRVFNPVSCAVTTVPHSPRNAKTEVSQTLQFCAIIMKIIRRHI